MYLTLGQLVKYFFAFVCTKYSFMIILAILNLYIIMKKILCIMAAFLCTMSISAQIMRSEELEKYAKEKYGDNWKQSAANLTSTLALDKNNSLTYTEVIEAPGKTKEQLYILLNYWYTTTFNDANSVIKLNDKEAGCIIGSGYVADIAEHAAGVNAYQVNIKPVIKTDIKDGKVRVTYTIQAYDVTRVAGGGATAAFLSGMSGTRTKTQTFQETWTLETCYPFVEKDKHMKTSSKAIVMTHAYSNVIMDKIKEAIKNGIAGNENEDW